MDSRKKGNIILLVVFFLFSAWLMNKSFGYDAQKHEFRVARHQVGDFGLHLSLIRSFSWGNNLPPESPFYPGKPLPYHYTLDLLVGLLERIGVRIDYALNGISVIFFTVLLYLVYHFSQLIFGKNVLLGLFSVGLFVFPSTLSFLDFFKGKSFSTQLFTEVWRLPDYLHKGPFDGSIISLFFTLNPFLNQRHLIVGLAVSMTIISFIVNKLLKDRKLSIKALFFLGIVVGLSTRVHSLVALGTAISIVALLIIFRRMKTVLPFAVPALIFALPHIRDILLVASIKHQFINPGYLVPRPLTLFGFLQFWWMNLGLSLTLIPFGYYYASEKQRKVFLAFFALFLIANIFQFSYRIEHNHSLITLFLIVANTFSASVLVRFWKKRTLGRFAVIVASVIFFTSGVLNLMVVKNDFQFRVSDAPSNAFIQWIRTSTHPESVFLAPQSLYDPVTLAGRKNYFGATYYLEVMGYDVATRRQKATHFFEAYTAELLEQARKDGIDYMVIPNVQTSDLPYSINREFLMFHLNKAYADSDVTVLQL